MHDQKERVFEMRRWNEALVTNMLPEHVAKHFLGSKKRDEVNMSGCVCQVASSLRPADKKGEESRRRRGRRHFITSKICLFHHFSN